MEKEEILAKSRAENKNQDVFELEVLAKGAHLGSVWMTVLGSVLLVANAIVNSEFDFGLFAMVYTPTMVIFWYKWSKLKRERELWMAVYYSIATVCLVTAYILKMLHIL